MTWHGRAADSGHAGQQWTAGTTWRSLLAGVLVVLLVVASLGWAAPVRAADCAVPAAAPPVRMAAPTPTVPPAPVIQIEGEDQATPVIILSSPVAATPVPTPDPLVQLTVELTAVAEALAACLTAGDAETTTLLAGERYLGQIFGGSTPLPRAEYVEIAEQLTPVPTRIVALLDVKQTADDKAQATVDQVVGNQLMRAEWMFEHAPAGDREPGENPWRLASERQLPAPAPAGAAVIDVAIGNRSFTLDPAAVAGPDVVLRGDNLAGEDHEMLVLYLEPGYTTDDLLRASGPDLPQEVTYIGELPVKAGAERDLVLVDLAPGIYTLVCLFPDEQGIPHLAQGMAAQFQITE